MLAITWRTISLENAKRAVKAYNDGTYGCVKNPDVDKQAREIFADGLGVTSGKILRQVEFIGKDYGGVAGQPSAIRLAPDIAADIFKNRGEYEQVAYSAKPMLQELPSRSTIEVLYRPFVKPHNNCRNWQVWGTKFWHFLNANAFPIADSRVNKFLELYSQSNSVDMYLEVVRRFREFALTHQEWLPPLQQVDGGLAWCDNKLWDKMCYGLAELR